jgi:hypothetical protein
MKTHFNLGIDTDLMERFTRLIGEGNRSNRICFLIEKDCTEMEAKQIGTKAKKIWFDKKIKPFILNFVGSRDLFSFIENEELIDAFQKSGIIISDSDIKLCIEHLIVEGE